MPISLLKIHSPASLRSDGAHHHVGIDVHDEIESAFTIKSETALSFVGIRRQGQFPNYEAVLPKAPLEARVVFRREELLEGLAKLSPTARKAQVPAVKLELSHSPVSIKTENDGTANSVALEHTRVSGKARDIGFNLHYLTQYVKSLETDTVSMKLFSKATCEVALFDAFRYQHLLMPLRF
jgi:DNA polymerase III sliding clamp (beta) subunit (PCNA family)